jgi:methyl-accepting chemotaxis protein
MNANFFHAAYGWLMHVDSENPDVVRRGKLLNVLITGVPLIGMLFIVLGFFDSSLGAALRNAGIMLMGILLCLVALYYSRTGRPARAAYLFLGTVWLTLTLILLTQRSIESATTFIPYLYAIPVMASGLTAGGRGPFVFATAGVLAELLALAVLPHVPTFAPDAAGRPQLVPPPPWYFTALYLAGYLYLVAFLSFLTERTLAAALRETRQRATSLAETRAGAARRSREQQLASALRIQSADLATTVQQQTVAASEQASGVQQVTATVEELAATAREIAFSAHEVSAAAEQVRQNVEVGQTSVAATSESVANLGERVAAIEERMGAVDQHVGQIGQIADLLAEIAENIHILALNAAIEAAGAGPYGPRFAVVAHEVQELANRARVASEQVQTQVSDIQDVTRIALASTRAGQTAAESVVIQMAQTHMVHMRIRESAEQANTLAAQIALGIDQQQMASAQVLETLRAFAHSVQEMANGSTRVTAATTRLSALSAELDAEQHATLAFETPQEGQLVAAQV